LLKNIENSKKIIHTLIKKLPEKRTCVCKDALKNSIITDAAVIPAKAKKDLDIIIGKYVK
jgi:hypothetical protein